MHIAIYISVIVLVCLFIVLMFIYKNKQDKKRLKDLNLPKTKASEEVVENAQTEQNLVKKTEIIQEITPVDEKIEPEFEEFSIDGEQNKFVIRERPRNPFDDLQEGFEGDDDEYSDDEVNQKFAEYEKFLRQSLEEEEDNLELEEDFDDDEINFDNIEDFSITDDIEDSQSKVVDMIKDLPPKTQEILMADIFGKKDIEEED